MRDEKIGLLSYYQNYFSSQRLGDLLLQGNLISRDQLILALKAQKEIQKPLGKILVSLGFISTTKLFKVLLKQATYRFLALFLTFFVGLSSFGMSKKAQAQSFESQDIQVQQAAILPAPNLKLERYSEKIFGTSEKKSTNTSAFTKWHVALSRTNRSMNTNDPWVDDILKFKGLSDVEKVKQVNAYVNQHPYIEDIDNWRKSDYWSTPAEFYANGGDCEDFALTKYTALKMLGIQKENMRLVIVNDKVKNIHHAILAVFTDQGLYILDNQIKTAMKARHINRYDPIYSINENAWWRHL